LSKGIRTLGTKAKGNVDEWITLTEKEKEEGKTPNAIEKATGTIGSFFAPSKDGLRTRDVVRELPGSTADIAKEIAKGGARFALSAGEAVARVPSEISKLVNPGKEIQEKIYEPETIPGLGILGPIESYQNQAAREQSKGGSGAISTLKAAGNIAMDEPVGVALKPLGLAFGAFIKGGGDKVVKEALDTIVKSVEPGEITGILRSIGLGEKASAELAEPLAKATTLDEVKGILGYTEKGTKETAKAVNGAEKGVSQETGQVYYHGTPAKYAEDIVKNGYDPKKAIELGSEKSGTMFLSTDKGYANGYSKTLAKEGDEGAVLAFKIKPDAVVFDVASDTIKKENGEVIQKNVTEFLNGRKGVAHPDYKGFKAVVKEYGVDVIKTKDGLETEILNSKVIQPVAEKAKAIESVAKPKKATFLIPEKPEDKKVFDEAAKWVTDWVAGKKPKMPSPEVEAYLSQFKSKKPLNLYRGTGSGKKTGLTSWTVNTRTAKEMGIESEKKGAQVLSEKINPNDILVDLNMLDSEVKDLMLSKIKDKRLRNDIDGLMAMEGEVIVKPRNAVESIQKEMGKKIETGVEGAPSIGDILKGKGPTVPPTEQVATAVVKDGGKERQFITRVKSDAPEMSDLLKGKYTPKSNKELVANAEKMITEDSQKAKQMAMTGTDDQSVAIANKMIEEKINIAKKATDEATKNEAYAVAAEIANSAARNLTEAGRAVQAASLLGKMTPEGMARFAAREIQKYNEQAGARTLKNFLGGAKKIPELTPEQLKGITQSMEKINLMEDGIEKARALQGLGKEIQKLIPSTLYEKVINVWKAGLLTGLKTTGVNLSSNLAHSMSEIAKDVPGALVDKIASLFTGERAIVLSGKDTAKGAGEGLQKGWDFLKTGFDERNIADKLDYKKVNFGKGKVADVLAKYTDTVFGLLGAEDQPFYYAAKARSLANQAAAKAVNEGLKGTAAKEFAQKLIENPTDDMVKYAVLDAETAVFQQSSWLAKKAKDLQKGLEIILPFAKTPANVAQAMINYSPVGVVKTIIENIGKGRFDQRLFSQGMGRGITGTGALAIGSALMANKLMNLSTPTGEKERKQWELEGRIPNSIKIGDKWRNIGVLGPLGMVLIIGGHLRKGIEETGSFVGGLTRATAGFGSALTEQTFLSGVNRAIDALKDPARSFEGFSSSLAGSIVPTLVADLARGTDTFERRSSGMVERIKSRLPGARQTLEPQVDTLGNVKKTPSFLEVIADPTRPGNPSVDEKDPVVMELRRLMDADYSVTPTQLGPTQGYESLTPEQNTQLWKLAGQMARLEIEKAMKSKSYARYDDEQKAQLVDKVVQDTKVESRARIVKRALEGMSESEQKNALAKMKEDGLLTRQVFSAYLSLKNKR